MRHITGGKFGGGGYLMEHSNFTYEEKMAGYHFLLHNQEPMIIISEDMLGFGHMLRVKRVHDKLSLQQLGKLLNMSSSVLSEVETDQRTLRGKKLLLVEDYLYRTLVLDGEIIEMHGEYFNEAYLQKHGISTVEEVS